MAPGPIGTAAYRYLTGRPLLDRPGNWPYLTRGAGRWAGWQRQMARITMPGLAATTWWCAETHPEPTRAAALAALVGAGVWARRRWRRRRFRRAYISPTVKALRVPLGTEDVSLHVDPGLGRLVARLQRPLSPAEEWVRERYGWWVEPTIRWPVDAAARAQWALWRTAAPRLTPVIDWFRRPRELHGPRIVLRVAAPFVSAEPRSMVSAIIKAKIPAGELVESWNQVGYEVIATWTPRKRPPSKVGLEALEARFGGLAEWEFYLGQAAGDQAEILSLRDDSPHIAVSAGTGAGKSVLAQLIAVQVLRRGGRVVILDRKGSHRWALGLAGVDYCTSAGQMHDALIRTAALADQRNSDALHEADDWDPGHRVLVICEELNATIGQLTVWWANNRAKDEPKRSPAITALGELLFMGRSAKVNVLAIAQMLTARAIGGPEARENFGVRCLARYTRNNWQMLVPEAAMPRASRTLGRWQIVVGGVATETQVCFLKPAQARAFARVTGHANGADGLDSALTSTVTGNGGKPVTDDELMSLADAAALGVLPWTKAAAKMRLSRARAAGRQVPAPRGKRGLQTDLYARRDLAAWAEAERAEAS